MGEVNTITVDVRPGDTLESIAQKYGVTVDALEAHDPATVGRWLASDDFRPPQIQVPQAPSGQTLEIIRHNEQPIDVIAVSSSEVNQPEPQQLGEEIVPFAYAIENPNEYVLKTLGEMSPEDQRDDQGFVTKDYLIQNFIGTAETHQAQAQPNLGDFFRDIILGAIVSQIENEFSKQLTLYDVAYQNSTILGELGLSEKVGDDVYAWLNGEDISSWDIDRILQMQHAITPMVDHPDYQGPSYANITGMEFSAPAHDLIEMFKHIQPVIAGTELPFDSNQATREMLEAYLQTGHTNLDLYYQGDLENPNFFALQDAQKIATIEKVYTMMTYADGFATWDHIPTFEEFQTAFADTSMDELATLGMELAMNTFRQQAEDTGMLYDLGVAGNIHINPQTMLEALQLAEDNPELQDMSAEDLYSHLLLSGDIDIEFLHTQLVNQGIDPAALQWMDERIALDAATDALEMGTAHFGASALDESRQYISAGCAEERRRLLDRLNGEIANMPTEAVLDIEVGTVKQTFVDYHAGELARLNGLTNRVLTYEEDRFESMQEQENLDELPLGIQVAVGAFSDIADVGFILREWYITKDFPAFDSVVTLLPLINYGMRKVIGGGLNFTDIVDFFRNSDEMVGVTDEVADIDDIMRRFDITNGVYVSDAHSLYPWPPNKLPVKPDPELNLFTDLHGPFDASFGNKVRPDVADQLGWTDDINAFENTIRSGDYGVDVDGYGRFPVEFMAIYTPNGKLLVAVEGTTKVTDKGLETTVGIMNRTQNATIIPLLDPQGNLVTAGSTITHSHPSIVSFSAQDIQMMIQLQAAEMRAFASSATENTLYVIKPDYDPTSLPSGESNRLSKMIRQEFIGRMTAKYGTLAPDDPNAIHEMWDEIFNGSNSLEFKDFVDNDGKPIEISFSYTQQN